MLEQMPALFSHVKIFAKGPGGHGPITSPLLSWGKRMADQYIVTVSTIYHKGPDEPAEAKVIAHKNIAITTGKMAANTKGSKHKGACI